MDPPWIALALPLVRLWIDFGAVSVRPSPRDSLLRQESTSLVFAESTYPRPHPRPWVRTLVGGGVWVHRGIHRGIHRNGLISHPPQPGALRKATLLPPSQTLEPPLDRPWSTLGLPLDRPCRRPCRAVLLPALSWAEELLALLGDPPGGVLGGILRGILRGDPQGILRGILRGNPRDFILRS